MKLFTRFGRRTAVAAALVVLPMPLVLWHWMPTSGSTGPSAVRSDVILPVTGLDHDAIATPPPTPAPTRAAPPTAVVKPRPAPTLKVPPPPPTQAPAPPPTAPPPPPVQASGHPHVMVIVMENHEYNAIIGSSSAPYINSLAQQYGLATNWTGVSHPSLPNYLALTSGSTQGVSNDGTSYVFNVDNVANQLATAGFSWKGYMEDMPSPCNNSGGAGGYAKKHNPFMYYADILSNPAQCNRVVPFTQFATDLSSGTAPDFMWVTPNLCNDMHDCSPSTGDSWLKTQMQLVQQSSWYKQGGHVIVTWDEGSTGTGGGGHVATIVVSATAHGQLTTAGNHYGTLRTIEETYGLPLLGAAASPSSGDLRSIF